MTEEINQRVPRALRGIAQARKTMARRVQAVLSRMAPSRDQRPTAVDQGSAGRGRRSGKVSIHRV